VTGGLTLGAALLLGFAASGHCLAMCGGISAALGLATDKSADEDNAQEEPVLIFNSGPSFFQAFHRRDDAAANFWGICGHQSSPPLVSAGDLPRAVAGCNIKSVRKIV